MLFAGRDVSVIEFPMKPHCNRCFGYMAMALDIDYWLVPQVHTFYHGTFTLDQGRVQSVIDVLRHVLERRGDAHLIRVHVPDEL